MTETLPDGFIGFAPELTHKTDRTHCDHCKEELHPNVYHACEGNREWKPDAHPVMSEAPPPMSPDLTHYHGVCPACGGEGTTPGHEGPDGPRVTCPACDGVGQMRAKV